ncbi:MAG: hypothetical protein Crog4KO_26070 [Crocinitomicaceae bacterium]
MINKDNYYEKSKGIDFTKLDAKFKEGKDFVDELTNSGLDWSMYDADSEIREGVDLYFKNLSNEISKGDSKKEAKSPPQTNEKKVSEPKVVKRQPNQSRKTAPQTGEPVESFSLELKFIKRFLNLDGKKRVRNHLRLFINALQRAIRDRLIRKKSPYAKEIMEIQKSLINVYEDFKNERDEIVVEVPAPTKKKYMNILGKQYEMLSIKLIKSYIGLQGKIIENIRAVRLSNRIRKAMESKKIAKKDPYYEKVKEIKSSLDSFIKKNSREGVLKIETQTLNGLELILNDSTDKRIQTSTIQPEPLNVDELTENYYSLYSNQQQRFYMSSTDLEKETFDHIGLTGKWFDFIGDPEVGFRAMTKGQPKMGKSFLMIEFAGELASNHGRVLYVAKEEGKSATLKEKLTQTRAAHANMVVSDYLPINLGDFDFVFLDSVTKLKLSPENLVALNKSFPNTSFIEIHQVTKQGSARGQNDFAHDPDILINVPSKGYAESNGRYNQGGEMHFFNEDIGSKNVA